MFFIVLLVSVIGYLINFYFNKRAKYPPGPIPYPFFGNGLTLAATDNPGKLIDEYAQKYGGICTVFMPQPTVIISDYDLIREACIDNGEALSWRPKLHSFEVITNGFLGLTFASGQHWQTQRRYTLHVLRDFGVGRNLMETKINVEIDRLLEHLECKIGTGTNAFDMLNCINVTVCSIIGTLMLGQSFSFEGDPFLKQIDSINSEFQELVAHPKTLMMDVYPILRHIPPFAKFNNRLVKNVDRSRRLFMKTAERQRQRLKENDSQEVDNYAMAYWRTISERRKSGKDDDGFNAEQLYAALSDLFGAGQETTVTTIRFAILYLCLYPKIQQKIIEEITIITGGHRVTMADKTSMPYTSAFIIELQRHANIISMNLFHTTSKDVTIRGHLIRRGTTVIPQISAVHSSEKYFKNANDFNPQRFLDNPKSAEKVIPFGVGKRSCMGEALAKMEIFLIFCTLVQNYDFEMAEESMKTDFSKTINRFSAQPQHFKCKITPRN